MDLAPIKLAFEYLWAEVTFKFSGCVGEGGRGVIYTKIIEKKRTNFSDFDCFLNNNFSG